MAKNNGNNQGGKAGVGIGMGLAAIAAAAGAYYFYGSKHAAQHRKQMKGWMIKAKGEVVERMEGLRELTEENYNKIVDQVSDKYKKIKKLDPAEVTALAAEMRKQWKNIASQMKTTQPKKKIAAKKVK